MACCGNSVSGQKNQPLNAQGCAGDLVKAKYVGTNKRAHADKNYYGFRSTGDVFCVHPQDLNHPNFEPAT